MVTKGVAALALGFALTSCGSSAPSAPTPPRPDILTIAPSVDALKLGEIKAFSAVIVHGDGARATVGASWSSDAPAVVSVSDDGRAAALGIGATAVHATYQSLSAAQRVRVVPAYGGTWDGKYQVVSCSRLGGDGPDLCRYFGPLAPDEPGAVAPLREVIDQTGDTVIGTLEFFSNTGALNETGSIEGSVDASGALSLSGTTSSADPSEFSDTTVSNWNSTLTSDANQMTGRFTATQTFRNAWGLQKIIEQCELKKMTRSQ